MLTLNRKIFHDDKMQKTKLKSETQKHFHFFTLFTRRDLLQLKKKINVKYLKLKTVVISN